ncbi:MAG: CorA family divalent cation transporter, partial [Actinomycetota bacterium]
AFHEDLRPYFADVSDHLEHIADSSGSMGELLNSALNLHLSVSTHRLNDIMRKVTSWAAIIGVATTIAGIYGMNFDLFPSGSNPYSFWIALSMIAISALGLFVYFRRKGWI